jgi:hypothetical protein
VTVDFEIVPNANGKTTVVKRTRHELKLDPALYWLPIARWVMAETNERAPTHLRNQAEAAFASRQRRSITHARASGHLR